MPFTGFPPATFAFLRGLAANNNRDWFAANKSSYERAVLAPFHLLLADIVTELAKRGIPLSGDPKKALLDGHRIEIRGFGVFEPRPRKRGMGRNIKTGASVDIPKGRSIRFKPGKDLRDIDVE